MAFIDCPKKVLLSQTSVVSFLRIVIAWPTNNGWIAPEKETGSNTINIKKIVFLGDKVFKDKRLKEVITSEEHKFWKFISSNVYINEDLINLDKRLLTNYFKDNGYFDVLVENSFVEFDSTNYFFDDVIKLNISKFYVLV